MYQLAQSVLKIGFALAERMEQEEVGGHSHDMLCTWLLSWQAIESLGWHLLAHFSPFFFSFYTNGHRKVSSVCLKQKWKYGSYRLSIASERLLENGTQCIMG